MAIGSSNISFSDIQTEYGGTTPISLSEYYKGGTYVPTSPNVGTTSSGGVNYVVAANTGTWKIPTTGQISVSDIANTSKTYTLTVTITSNQTDFNLKSRVESVLGTFTAPVAITVTINSGIYVYSTSTSVPGFDTGTGWVSGSSLLIVNGGYIVGRGGAGGNGTNNYAAAGTAGGAGGTALNLGINTTINNTAGYIYGGGGGGGGSGTWWWAWVIYNNPGGPGGGGGAGNGTGGSAAAVYYADGYGWTTGSTPTNGSAGTLSAAGSTGTYGRVTSTTGGESPETYGANSGNGGAGGAFGSAGSGGSDGYATDSGTPVPYHTPGPSSTGAGAGGAAGKAVNLNGYSLTYTGGGDGGNNATQVKGAQS